MRRTRITSGLIIASGSALCVIGMSYPTHANSQKVTCLRATQFLRGLETGVAPAVRRRPIPPQKYFGERRTKNSYNFATQFLRIDVLEVGPFDPPGEYFRIALPRTRQALDLQGVTEVAFERQEAECEIGRKERCDYTWWIFGNGGSLATILIKSKPPFSTRKSGLAVFHSTHVSFGGRPFCGTEAAKGAAPFPTEDGPISFAVGNP